MVDSAFTVSGLLQNIRSIQEDPPLKNESNSVPVFELTSPAHQLLHLALKSPITIMQNGDVSAIFDHLKKRFLQ